MQFRVPQNIAMEDRIVGPLSPIQFGIVVVGGGLSFFVSQNAVLGPAAYPLGGILAVTTVVLAMGKFNGQAMYNYVKFFIAYLGRPRTRIWRHHPEPPELITKAKETANTNQLNSEKNVSLQDIAHLARVLDSRGIAGNPPDISPPNKKQ